MNGIGTKIGKSLSRSLTAFVVGFGVCEMIHASYGWSLVDCFFWRDPVGLDMRIVKTELQILKAQMSHLQFQFRETLDACIQPSSIQVASRDGACEQVRKDREEQKKCLEGILEELQRVCRQKETR